MSNQLAPHLTHRLNSYTQDEAVLNWLNEHGSIEPMQALSQLGCYRLSAVIHRLRKAGYKITTKRVTKQGRFRIVNFAKYYLDNEP